MHIPGSNVFWHPNSMPCALNSSNAPDRAAIDTLPSGAGLIMLLRYRDACFPYLKTVRQKGTGDLLRNKTICSPAAGFGAAFLSACMSVLMSVSLGIGGCAPGEPVENITVTRDVRAGVFIPADSAGRIHLAIPAWYRFPAGISLKRVLDSLGNELERRYFSNYGMKSTGISLTTRDVFEIPAGSRLFRIGVINIVDPEGTAKTTFFQGSSGGRSTQLAICATFTQPRLSPPLLDGVVVLYNGTLLPPMDHINLSGLLTPDRCEREVVEASLNQGEH